MRASLRVVLLLSAQNYCPEASKNAGASATQDVLSSFNVSSGFQGHQTQMKSVVFFKHLSAILQSGQSLDLISTFPMTGSEPRSLYASGASDDEEKEDSSWKIATAESGAVCTGIW